MKQKSLIIAFLLFGFMKICCSQEFNKHIDKDSLFAAILKDIPEESREVFRMSYEEGNEESKELLLLMFAMPRSSKDQMIDNYEKNSKAIVALKNEYSKLVPDSLIVYVEFNPGNKIINMPESIDFKIYQKNPNGKNIILDQEWDLDVSSAKLAEILLGIGWNQDTLIKIKALLDAANCVSIENGENITIGFARSGMGKYYYKVFDHQLSKNEIEKHNDGCNFIYYKDSIVLKYGGGAVGPQCFPDE